MNIQKFISDVFTGNTVDLKKRVSLLKRKVRRVIYNFHNGNQIDKDVTQIPIIINNRNRLTYLRMLVDWLELNGFANIVILDNDSTYPPLLEYYARSSHRIVYLKKNSGPRALWNSPELSSYWRDYYIYTDPDVVPADTATKASVELMYKALRNNLGIDKVGFSLCIDDLPESYALKEDVIKWEKQFWERPVDDRFFMAPIDTTFALYAPYAQGGGECKALRTNIPHIARHMPWYENSAAPTEENEYYRMHSETANSHWTQLSGIK